MKPLLTRKKIMNKILWNDLETTGTDPKKHSIIQIAAAVESDGEIVDQIEIKMAPLEGRLIDTKALDVNGYTMDQIESFQPQRAGYNAFRAFLNKHGFKGNKLKRFIPAGYNNGFDLDFFFDWHNVMENHYAFWDFLQFQPIDIYPVLVCLWREGKLDTTNVQLGTVCQHFGIEIKAHDAVSDLLASRSVYKKVMASIMHGLEIEQLENQNQLSETL